MGRSSGGSSVSVPQLAGLGAMARTASLGLTAPTAWSAAWTVSAFGIYILEKADERFYTGHRQAGANRFGLGKGSPPH